MKKKLDNSTSSTSKSGRKTSLSRWKFCVHADKRQMLQDLTQSLQIKPTKDHVLWELANCICSAVSADGFRWVEVEFLMQEFDRMFSQMFFFAVLGLRIDNNLS